MAEAMGLRAEEFGLFTDLYQLTMAQSYLQHHKNRPATFSLLIRTYPQHYTYMVAVGLATVLEYLEQVSFPPEALSYLRHTGRFSDAAYRKFCTNSSRTPGRGAARQGVCPG
jgi:nicotinate phosphoribosyltransferase